MHSPVFDYKITIRTLNGEEHCYDVSSNSDSDCLCQAIFNQTPNVRQVQVTLNNQC